MKKLLSTFIGLLVTMYVNAQATDLVIDCQTPGWLSSKINYGDQQTVRNLKVTGYINSTDLDFIGSLTQLNLCGVVDLGEVTIIGNSWNGCFRKDYKAYNDYPFHLQKLILPKTLTEYKNEDNSGLIEKSRIDTLVFDTHVNKLSFNRVINHMIIGEEVDSIMCLKHVESGHLPTSLKYIGRGAFCPVEDLSKWNINVFPSLEYLGYIAFTNTSPGAGAYSIPSNGETLPDSIFFPNIRHFCMSSMRYKEGMHIFFGDKLEEIFRDDNISYTYPWHASVSNVSFHMKTMTPPAKGGFYDCTSSVKIYVPKGAKQAYVDAGLDKYTIIEEPVELENIEIEKHELILDINETNQLSAKTIPENADDQQIDWTSGNEEIVTVNENGQFKAVSGGQTYIYAISTATGIKDSCLVTVRQPVSGITVSPQTHKMNNIGESITLEATVLPENATNKGVTWRSSNENVGIVARGKVVATGYGTAVIYATTEDGGYMDFCTITVEDATAIRDFKCEEREACEVRDLMGNRVKTVRRGQMYIRNGRKFIGK